jgi:glycosyltransferase involved in cell wall biosynthesis
MRTFPPQIPLNQVSRIQPVAPDWRPALHVNILIASMAIGGAERNVHDTLIGLAQRRATGKLFLLHDVISAYEVRDSDQFRVFRLGKLEKRRKLQTVALEVLASPCPVLYTHLIRAHELQQLWDMGVITIPVIQNSEPGWHDSPHAYNHPNVPFIVAVSQAVAEQLQTAGCEKPVTVVRHELQRWPDAAELEKNRRRIRQQYGIPDGTLLIGMVGQFKAQKAYPRAVRVLHLVQQFLPAKLMILGAWDHVWGAGRVTYTATCRKALELGVTPDLILPGNVHPVEPYYAAFDVFLNTSLYEGLSIATLEAIQSGCPVVTADAGGQREALPSNAALIEDLSDIRAYAEAIRTIGQRRERAVVKPPPRPDLIPRLWCLLSKHGVHHQDGSGSGRIDTIFITSNLNPGGAQRSLTNLLGHLPRTHKIALCIMGKVLGEGYLEELEAASVPVLAMDHSATMLDRVERVLDLIEKMSVRTVCFWNLDPQIKLLVTKILHFRSIKIVDVSPGPMLFNEMELQLPFQRRISFSGAEYFRRLDGFISKYLNGGPPAHYEFPRDKIVIIPNGVPLPPASAGSHTGKTLLDDSADPALAIVTCCRIVPNKRLEWLIDMMSVLSERVPGVTLTVVGGVDQRHIPYWNTVMEKLERSGLDNIHFAGSRADVFSFLDQFRVFVMVSHAQGCPNASLEAMAMGVPIVANADGGTAEQIDHGTNGFLVSGEYPSEMATHVEFLLKNPETARAFGQAGREIARRQFPMSLMVQRYLQVFAPAYSEESKRLTTVRTQDIRPKENYGKDQDSITRRPKLHRIDSA